MPTPIARSYGPPPTAPSAPSDRGPARAPAPAVGQPAPHPDRGFGPIASTPPRPTQPPTAGQSRTKQALAKLHDFSNNLRQRAADRIQPRTPGAGHHARQAPVGYATQYPNGGAGTRQPYAQNYAAMTQSPGRRAGYLKAGLKWGALATMPIALTFLSMSSMPSMGGMGSVMYPFLAYGAMNSFMTGAAAGMSMHRRRAIQTQLFRAWQAHQQGMPTPSQAVPYPMQQGMPQQPHAYPQQAGMYPQPNPYQQQPGAYAQPYPYRQQPGLPPQAHPYQQQTHMPPQAHASAPPNSVNRQRIVPPPPPPPSPAPTDLRVWPPSAEAAARGGDPSTKQRVAETPRALPTQPSSTGFYVSLKQYDGTVPPQSEGAPETRTQSKVEQDDRAASENNEAPRS